jgi:hypothetical protein
MALEVKSLTVGAKVMVNQAMDAPEGVKWDDDAGRTSGLLKKRLISSFFKQDKRITAEVVYIGKESEREALRRKGLIKIRLRHISGSMLTICTDPRYLTSK